MDDKDQLRTVPEVARELHIHTGTLYRLIRSGQIEAVKIGGAIRVRSDTIERIKTPKVTP